MADSYLTFAADYDWLFDDDGVTRGGAINHPATARLLQRTSRGSAVLDASCGTGINAAALARRGFDVWATDGSEAMIDGGGGQVPPRAAGDPGAALPVGGSSGHPRPNASTSCSASGTRWSTPRGGTPWWRRSPG